MSKTVEALWHQFQKLPPAEREDLLQLLLRSKPPETSQDTFHFPSVKLSGGRITSGQVAEVLDDE